MVPMQVRAIGAAIAALWAAAIISGCGSSSTPNVSVSRAADVTAGSPGYQLTALMTIASPKTGTIGMTMSGYFDHADRSGSLNTVVRLGSRSLAISELVSRLRVYMGTGAIPGGSALTGGKPFVEIDMSRAAGGLATSSLPTATDPTQFVDYLRAVSTKTTKLGTLTIRGVRTTHYHAAIDLDRYPTLVAAPERQAAQRTMGTLEAAIGSHTLPLDVWVDGHKLVRRLAFALNECVSKSKFQFSMAMDLFHYGPQPKPRIPPANKVYDLTPLLSNGLQHAKLGCS
jgi:hypothetical protein